MPTVEFDGQFYPIDANETLLNGLLRQHVGLPHGCKAGACQCCLMKVTAGDIPKTAQVGLKESQKQLGYILTCCAKPESDLKICEVNNAMPKFEAEVLAYKMLSADVLGLHLTKVFDFKAGQYLNIWHANNVIRSYSIASVAEIDDYIELHVKIIPNGVFSQWAQHHLKVKDKLTIQGPIGHCIYSPNNLNQPFLLIGVGTGLAPLYGILRDALNQGHQGAIDLIVGAKNEQGIYLQAELLQLAQTHDQVKVHFVVQTKITTGSTISQDDLYDFVKKRFPSTKHYGVFLCGAESFVRKMKKQCFLAGANMQDIHSDAFLPCS